MASKTPDSDDGTECLALVEVTGCDGPTEEERIGAHITFMYRARCLSLHLMKSDSCFGDDKWSVDHAVDLITRSLDTEDIDEIEELQGEAVDPLIDALNRHLSTTVSREVGNDHDSHLSLEDVLFPPTTSLRVEQDSHGTLTFLEIDHEELCDCQPHARPDSSTNIAIDPLLPLYHPAELKVTRILSTGNHYTVCQIQIGGQEMLCKAGAQGMADSILEQEESRLRRYSASGLHLSDLRLPALLGYVKHPTTSVLLGFLRQWIASETSLTDLATGGWPTTTLELRQKWAGQLQDTVEQLHAHGIVWGDAKPDNLVIDTDDNIWLIDFGGGWTNGWVDPEMADSMNGDTEAVRKISQMLVTGTPSRGPGANTTSVAFDGRDESI